MLEILQDKIEEGRGYPAGERLPRERRLAVEYQVPQSQIRRKLQDLVQKGYLECFRSNGYFVCTRKSRHLLHPIVLCLEAPMLNGINDDFYTGLLFHFAESYSLNLFTIPVETENRTLFSGGS